MPDESGRITSVHRRKVRHRRGPHAHRSRIHPPRRLQRHAHPDPAVKGPHPGPGKSPPTPACSVARSVRQWNGRAPSFRLAFGGLRIPFPFGGAVCSRTADPPEARAADARPCAGPSPSAPEPSSSGPAPPSPSPRSPTPAPSPPPSTAPCPPVRARRTGRSSSAWS
ncbi:hypothetical protein E6R18_18790 [Streptomyces sp. A1277]|nr:hypothetical protein E6R18_18790 [Streptomyces sp. A1277]